jgi:hypothetical protein
VARVSQASASESRTGTVAVVRPEDDLSGSARPELTPRLDSPLDHRSLALLEAAQPPHPGLARVRSPRSGDAPCRARDQIESSWLCDALTADIHGGTSG